MPKGFTKTFAENLNKMYSFEVKEAEAGDCVQENRLLIAPGVLETCVVYGMPAAAVQAGVIHQVVDLKDLAPHILQQLQRRKTGAA